MQLPDAGEPFPEGKCLLHRKRQDQRNWNFACDTGFQQGVRMVRGGPERRCPALNHPVLPTTVVAEVDRQPRGKECQKRERRSLKREQHFSLRRMDIHVVESPDHHSDVGEDQFLYKGFRPIVESAVDDFEFHNRFL